jgi:hypothetical protein
VDAQIAARLPGIHAEPALDPRRFIFHRPVHAVFHGWRSHCEDLPKPARGAYADTLRGLKLRVEQRVD